MGEETKETKKPSEEDETQKNPPQKKNKVLIAILIIVIAILGIIIYMLLHPKEKNKDVLITPDNVKEIQEQLDDPNPDAQYTIEMNNVWKVDASTSTAASAYVKNAVENHRTVFFDIILEDTQEQIYKSDYLKVGNEVRGITFTRQLEPGDYRATLTYHLVDDNNEEVATTSVYVTLNVS